MQLPPSFTAGVKERLPNCMFASNPCRYALVRVLHARQPLHSRAHYCRIRFYTQEIVVFRADTFSRIRRHCVVPPVDTEPQLQQLVATICEQAHLCPLPLTVQPVYWDYDHALRLYPLPDVVSCVARATTTNSCRWYTPRPTDGITFVRTPLCVCVCRSYSQTTATSTMWHSKIAQCSTQAAFRASQVSSCTGQQHTK
jgi:hypothetical protein